MSKLTVILGAGFSYDAGLPLGKDIQARFDRDQRGKLLLASSSEWMWIDDKSDTDKHNFTLNYDYMAYSYILNEYIKQYKLEKGSFINYEDFYQYINDTQSNIENCKPLFEKAKKAFVKDNPTITKESHHFYPFTNPNYYRIKEIVNYLIWDLLQIPKAKEELIESYRPFIEVIKKYDEVDIFTLNHDLLLELLLEFNQIEFTKGFSMINSNIQYEGEPLLTFQNDFKNIKIRLHKLHGSVDCYQFEHCTQNGSFLKRTGEGTYYLPGGYRARHVSVRIDINTGEIIQDFNADAVPKFITGTNKLDLIESDYMYSQLYKNFFTSIEKAHNLLISGYSFRDKHINKALENNNIKNIINQNPYDKYPFKQACLNVDNVKEITQQL